jgi:hypothetical protein
MAYKKGTVQFVKGSRNAVFQDADQDHGGIRHGAEASLTPKLQRLVDQGVVTFTSRAEAAEAEKPKTTAKTKAQDTETEA